MTHLKFAQSAKRRLKVINRRDSFSTANTGFTRTVSISGFSRMYTVPSVDMIFALWQIFLGTIFPSHLHRSGAAAHVQQVSIQCPKFESVSTIELGATMCNKCYCFIYDHMARPLRHDDISKLYYREKSIKRILPEITDEMMRLLKRYPNCIHDASFIYSDFTHICIVMVEAGFVRRFVGPNKIELKNPVAVAKEWFGQRFLELTNSLPQIHSEHSTGVTEAEYKRMNEIAANLLRLSQEQKMNNLRIQIPTIQIVVQDDWNGLYE